MAIDFRRTASAPHDPHSFSRSDALFARIHIDLTLLLLLLLLAGCGLLILYSGSGQSMAMVERQAIHFGIGFVLMTVAAQISPRQYRILAPWGYVISLVLLIAVLVAGVGAKGAQRWLDLPGLPRFQPSELVKLALPLSIAWYQRRVPAGLRY